MVVLGCCYLLLADMIEVAFDGPSRAVIMVVFLALLLCARTQRTLLARTPRALVLLLGVVAAIESLLSIPTLYHVHAVSSMVIAGFIATYSLHPAWVPARFAGRVIATRLRWACVATIPVVCLGTAVLVPKMTDIGATSLSAVAALLHGESPYQAGVDPSGVVLMHEERFAGYKYTPLTPLTYLPFIAAFGGSGLLIVNVLSLALAAGVIHRMAVRFGSPDPLWGVGLFLATPLVGLQVMAYQVNDLLAVLPIFVAFLVWQRRPGLAGLLLGISVSFKALPAPLAMLLLLPTARRDIVSYCAGIVVGLIPTAVFAAWDPVGFYNNVVLFNLVRPTVKMNWLAAVPPHVRLGLKVVFATTCLAVTAYGWVLRWSIERRMIAYVSLAIGLLLISPISADNYWLWWIPVLLALMGRAAQGCQSGHTASTTSRQISPRIAASISAARPLEASSYNAA